MSVLRAPLLSDPALPLTFKLLRVPFTCPSNPSLSPGAYFPSASFAEGAKPLTNFPSPSEVKERLSTLKSNTVLSISGSPESRPSAYPLTPLPDSVKSMRSILRSLTGPSTSALWMSKLTDMSLSAGAKYERLLKFTLLGLTSPVILTSSMKLLKESIPS